MPTKTQKNFRKEMKKFEKQQKKAEIKQSLSYIYQNEYIPETGESFSFLSYMLLFIVRIAFIIGLLSITGIADPLIKNFSKLTQTESMSQPLITNIADNQR